jgi:hypothetical protein
MRDAAPNFARVGDAAAEVPAGFGDVGGGESGWVESDGPLAGGWWRSMWLPQ